MNFYGPVLYMSISIEMVNLPKAEKLVRSRLKTKRRFSKWL